MTMPDFSYSYFRERTQVVRSILLRAEPFLKADDVVNAGELLAHNEFGVALELICTQLQEYEVAVPTDLEEAIQQEAEVMGLDRELWEWMVNPK